MVVRDRAPLGFDRPVPALEPAPVPGCSVCELCAQDRETARAGGHTLTVLSCNGVIAGHPHRREGAK
ncbi:hypothetical protein [Streptomyces albus]|uniref:hypothetical protein n=1 Tax=Streptomyces albus TaxID=1888 RepID=UPI000ADA5AC6|nr:hypothetical protein [Streptomyces albus]